MWFNKSPTVLDDIKFGIINKPLIEFTDIFESGLIKVGPVHIGSTAPNSSAAGFTSSSKGETWLDTASTHIFKVFDGSSFQSVKAVASVSAGQPANPIDGQLHWDTSGGGNGVLKIYLASISAWVNV